MARVVARFPDRLIGVALIPTTTEQVGTACVSRSILLTYTTQHLVCAA